MLFFRLFVIFAVVCLLSGCSSLGGGSTHATESASNPELTVDGLRRWPGSGFAEVWVRPGVDLTPYSKILLKPVFVSYKRPPRRMSGSMTRGNFALNSRQMEIFKSYLTDIFISEFEKSPIYRVVKEPGLDVLEVDPSIIDLVVNAPAQSAGRDRYYATSTADMTLLMELRDSETGELLARIADRRLAKSPHSVGLNRVYYSNPVSNSQAVRSTFRRWARILVNELDRLNALQKEQDGRL